MKLPLLHHGYQGKHERGQVQPQRDDRPTSPDIELNADEAGADSQPGPDAYRDFPVQSRSATDEPAGSERSV
jgi:hypothetical protein